MVRWREGSKQEEGEGWGKRRMYRQHKEMGGLDGGKRRGWRSKSFSRVPLPLSSLSLSRSPFPSTSCPSIRTTTIATTTALATPSHLHSGLFSLTLFPHPLSHSSFLLPSLSLSLFLFLLLCICSLLLSSTSQQCPIPPLPQGD